MASDPTAYPSDQYDIARRFLFEDADIRGESVSLKDSYRDILAIHQYAPGVARLLGEFLAASVLLSSTLKFDGKLILQARSEGQIPLLMAECNDQLQIRGIARGAEQATALHNSLLLANGQLVITIDPTDGQRYQGIVLLEEDSLAASIDSYFATSEQLGTRIWLAADGERASGLLLQQLPAQISAEAGTRSAQWDHVCTLAATVTSPELLQLDPTTLLHRLYHEDPVSVFEPRTVQFACNCSRERTLNALISIGSVEIRALLDEMETISMDCEFCNQQYHFSENDLQSLLEGPESKTLH